MVDILRFLPRRLLSRWVGAMSRWTCPQWFIRGALSWFVARYRINLNEAEFPLEKYKSINELFTRRLKAGCRPVGSPPLHPADAMLTQVGRIDGDQLIQVKGLSYSASDLLGAKADYFDGGIFATYYLCPTDYHRVHAPVSGKIRSCTHLGATLWPVNEESVRKIKNLFIQNERTVTWIEADLGQVAVVLVGATNVGQIHMSFDSEIVTNRRPLLSREYSDLNIEAGEELGVFHMGSTVVVLYPQTYEGQKLFSLQGQPVQVNQPW